MKAVIDYIDGIIRNVFQTSKIVTQTHYCDDGVVIEETQVFKGTTLVYESTMTFYNREYYDRVKSKTNF